MQMRLLSPDQDTGLSPDLAMLLMDTVEDGASIGFMADLTQQQAESFWADRMACAGKGHYAILAAFQDQRLVGTVGLDLHTMPNQPHRAQVQKMMVARHHQRRGLGGALLALAEAEARRRDRWLLTLDTISGGPAARLYERCGWERVGDIPAYAQMPYGGLAPTTIYFKRL